MNPTYFIISLSLIAMINCGKAFCQTVTVRDQSTREAIENVAIFNVEKSKLSQTDNSGIASLHQFNENDVLLFQHPSYHLLTVPFSELSKGNNNIFLSEKVLKFDDIVISANKWEQDKSEVPAKILSISPAEVEFRNPQTSADLLESTGQVFVQKSQLGGGSPMIRGFAANRLLIVIDGVRMNNIIYRSGNLQNVITLDANSLKGAEVIFGPGSVIYGSDAIGGVMDFHTIEPKFSAEGTKLTGKGFSRYSTANHEKSGHIQLDMGITNFAASLSFSFNDFEDLKTGNKRTDEFPEFGKRFSYVERINNIDSIVINSDVNLQRFSGYNQTNIQGKLRFRLSDNLFLDYGFYHSNSSDIPRYDRLIETRNGMPRNAEWYYGPQKWQMQMMKMQAFNSKGIFDAAKFTIAWQRMEESRNDRRFQDLIRRSREEKVSIISINTDFDKSVSDNQQLFYGIEALTNSAESSAFTKNIETGQLGVASTRYPDGGTDYFSLAAYVSYKNTLNKNLILNLGSRYSYYDLRSKITAQSVITFPFSEININNGAFNGSIGLVLKRPENWKFDLSLSSGFRSPNLDDVGKVFDSEPGNIIVPNQNLKPEFSYNFETGITRRIHDIFQIYGVGYVTLLENAMVRRDFLFNGQDSIIYDGVLSRVQALTNTGKAIVYGGSVNLKWAIDPDWSLASSLTFSEGEDKTDNIPLRHTTPVFGQTSLTYQLEKLRIEFYSRYNSKRRFGKLPPSEQNKIQIYTANGSLSWYTLNLKGTYTLNNYITLNAGIENILNKHYRPYSSGISAPGRNFIVAIRGQF